MGTLRVAQAVEKAGFQSIAFCLPEAEQVRAIFLRAGFRVAGYNGIYPSLRHPGPFMRASLELAREFRRQQVDLVHCADLLGAYYAGLAGRIAHLPVLCHVRNRFEEISRRERGLLRSVHRFAFVSQDTWHRFGCPVQSGRGTVIYDGIDIPPLPSPEDRLGVRREFHLPDDTPLVGMVARIAPQKDYFTLAKAAVRVLSAVPQARFLIIGDHQLLGEHRKHHLEVLQVLRDLGIEVAFTFTGERNDVPRLLGAIDVFVLSTHQEGLPLVILEAMAQAKPVVATAVDGIPEIVQDGEIGLLYPHLDHERLAAHVLHLLTNQAESTKLGQAGRNLVRTRFSTEQFATSMNALYTSLLK